MGLEGMTSEASALRHRRGDYFAGADSKRCRAAFEAPARCAVDVASKHTASSKQMFDSQGLAFARAEWRASVKRFQYLA
jgi:hypothetical protein